MNLLVGQLGKLRAGCLPALLRQGGLATRQQAASLLHN
jgi:hypothetical protein